VSDNAAEVLLRSSRKLGARFAHVAIQALAEVWKQQWDQLEAGTNRNSASTACVRCAKTITDIAVSENEFMQIAQSSGGTETVVRMLKFESDPLLQLSALDLIDQLAATQPFHAARTRWLLNPNEDSNTPLRTILLMAGGLTDDMNKNDRASAPDPLLGGSALRVVASLCRLLHTEDSAEFDNGQFLLTSFHRSLHNWQEGTSSEVNRLAIIDAISSFASASDSAMELILDDPVTRNAWLSFRSVAQSKLKAAILISVAQALDPTLNVNYSADRYIHRRLSSAMTVKLFAAVGQTNDPNQADTMGILLKLAKSPIPEIRVGVYTLLGAVAKLQAAGQILWNHGEFFPLILSRDESTKEGRQAKYDIVEAILSSDLKTLLADGLVKQLETYRDQGPHYKKALTWDVATD